MTSVYQPHNHQHCIKGALEEARSLCARKGVRLTSLRETVLELIWQSHRPVGAYEVLAELTRLQHKPAQPPTVYRALDFLLEQGLIHRLSSLNAFIGCPHPEEKHKSCFLICEKCKVTLELDNKAINTAIEACAQTQGFHLVDTAIEVRGLCLNCQNESEA